MHIKIGSMGIIVPGASITANLTKIYYSGSLSDFDKSSFNAFYGKGIDGYAGYGASGATGSISFSHTLSTYKNFTIGFGLSIGLGTPGPGGGLMQYNTKKW